MRLLMKMVLVVGIFALSASLALAHPGEVIQKKDLGSGFNKGTLDCTGAVSITCGDVVQGTNVGAPANVDYYSCQSWNALAGEVVYELVLDDDYEVTVYLLPNGTEDLSLFVVDGCDEDMCLASSDGSGDEEIVISLAANTTYYVVVDGYNADDEGAYALSITCELSPDPPVELQGAEDCADGVCLEPSFQRAITGTTVGYANDFDVADAASSCTGYGQSSGPDVVYEVGLTNGNTLDVSLERDGYWDQCLYLVTDCNDMDSCVAGSDAGAVDTIEFTHAGPPTLYYLIVDGYTSTNAGSYTLTYTHYGTECDDPVATEEKSWEGVKALYR